MSVSVRLTPRDLKKVKNVAKKIWTNHKNKGHKDKCIGKIEQSYNKLLKGLKGEKAFAKYYGLSMNTDIIDDGDDYDFKMNIDGWGDFKVDVKTTDYRPNPTLVVKENHIDKADIYVLVREETPEDYLLLGLDIRQNMKGRGTIPAFAEGADHENFYCDFEDLLDLPGRDDVSQVGGSS